MPDTVHAMRTEERRQRRGRGLITLARQVGQREGLAAEHGRPGRYRVAGRAGASVMTLLERDCYLSRNPGDVNVTYGYPEGMNPGWIRDYQLHPRSDFLDAPPSELAATICRYFQRLFRCPGIYLTPSCSLAFTVAARALIQAPGDECIVLDTSYDSYPVLLTALGAKVVYARRAADGGPDCDSVRAACTERTRAVVIVCPDNPLGVVARRDVLEELIALCTQRGLTLLADYSLAELNPLLRPIPLVSRLAGSKHLSWILLGDTGKLLGLNGSKFGALACSPSWQDAIEAAASAFFCHYSQYDLYLLAAILSDPRFAAHRLQVSGQIAANYELLRGLLGPPLVLPPLQAGSFCLIDAAGLGTDDVGYAALLRDRYRVLVVPVSWFPAAHRARPETRVRVALARPRATIALLAAALNDSVTALAGRPAW